MRKSKFNLTTLPCKWPIDCGAEFCGLVPRTSSFDESGPLHSEWLFVDMYWDRATDQASGFNKPRNWNNVLEQRLLRIYLRTLFSIHLFFFHHLTTRRKDISMKNVSKRWTMLTARFTEDKATGIDFSIRTSSVPFKFKLFEIHLSTMIHWERNNEQSTTWLPTILNA